MLTSSARRLTALLFVLFAALSLVGIGCEDEGGFSSSGFTLTEAGVISSSSSSTSSGGSSDGAVPDATIFPIDASLPDSGLSIVSVGGTVTGLAGATGLVLQLNGGKSPLRRARRR